jgi:hypothetical protein
MPVGKRHQDDIARRDAPALTGGKLDAAFTFRDQVKYADMTQMSHRAVRIEALRTDDAERRRKAGVEKHRAGQTHGA